MASAIGAAEERILEGLSESQREAVLHGDGPLLIVAGAGTGKTTVLTRRIAHLIASKRARPEEILALTFTEKAALEMAERVDQLIPYGYAETWISTFHAFGDRVLRQGALEAGIDPEFRVLSRPEQIIFLRERLFALPLRRFRPLGDPTRHLDRLLGVVSRAKDEDVSPAAYRAFAEALAAAAGSDAERDEAEAQLEVAAFYESYDRLLVEAGALDFGDQIHRALELLRARPAALARLRERYRYLLVDEFQDTNHAQLELVRLVAGEAANITVVGDDDQAIYRWRGAASANLMSFLRLYPQARRVVLTLNYRSTQEVLDVAARLISYNNPFRLEVMAGIDKRLRSERGAGAAVRQLRYDTASAEADGVAAEVERLLAAGFRPRDVALLVRSNADAEPFLPALNLRGLPYRFSGSRGLYAREEVRHLVAFLRVLARPSDSVSAFFLAAASPYAVPEPELLRLNDYARRKSRPLLDVFRALPGNEELVSVSGEARARIARLVADVESAAQEVPHRRTGEVLYRYLQACGVLARLASEASAENEARVRNVARFFDAVRAYGEYAEHDRVPSFVEHLELLREAGDDPAVAEADADDDAVQIVTVHKAKGLEFAAVFLVGCVEGRFPVQRRPERLELPAALARDEAAPGDAHLQEERRLFYVGMTRARDELVLTSAADYGTARTRKLSRFVVEALDLASPTPLVRRSRAIEALARNRPPAEPRPLASTPLAEGRLRLSFGQLDDYASCPYKYRYVHVLRVPLLAHHRVVYGSAIHKAVQELFRAQLEDRGFGEDELLAAFRAAWISEGFLSREHEERRLRAGEDTLRRFLREQQREPLRASAVEKEFAFYVDRTKIVGRYDLVVESAGGVSIVDFKTSAVDDPQKARERAEQSLQLDLYALAWLRTRGRLPDWVELRFVESGTSGGKRPTADEAARTEAGVREVAERIRAREFPATPSPRVCAPCAFRDICPYAAGGPVAR